MTRTSWGPTNTAAKYTCVSYADNNSQASPRSIIPLAPTNARKTSKKGARSGFSEFKCNTSAGFASYIIVKGMNTMDMMLNVTNKGGGFGGSLKTPDVFTLTSIVSMNSPLAPLGRRRQPVFEEGAANMAIVQLNLVLGLHLCQTLGFSSAYQERSMKPSPPSQRFPQAARHPHSAGTRQLSRLEIH